jgi:hypothetical protein
MAFVVVTAGTVFYQSSNPSSASPPAVSQQVPLPPAVTAAPTFAPSDIAKTAEEFRRASEPFRQSGRVVEPAKMAALKSGQENLDAARAESAKGNKQKAEEYLKLVRAAIEQLKKD